MTTKNKKRLLLIVGGGLVGLGIYAVSRRSANQQQPPAPYTPPTNGYTPPPPPPGGGGAVTPVVITPPPAYAPVGIGSTVKAKNDTGTYNGAGMTAPYEYGGSDGDGNLTAGSYAGTVIDANALHKSFKVRNFTYPAEVDAPGWGTGNTRVYEYWVPQSAVTKA